MNIVFLCRLYKPHVGGVEKHVEKISQILSQKHKITIITEQHDGALPETEIYPEAKVYRIRLTGDSSKSKKWTIWKWIWANRSILYQADVIHIHDVFYWTIPLLLLFTKPRLFMTFHGYEGSRPPGMRQIFWHKLAEMVTWGNICIGDFHTRWYHTRPDIVSYGAVDPTGIERKKRSGAIFLGRLDDDTGILDYVRAAVSLHLDLDVYGDGPGLSDAQNISQNTHGIKFHGFVKGAAAKLPSYEVAFVSRYLGILEALICGTPVIAHSDSAIKLDYLKMAPFADFIHIAQDEEQVISAVRYITMHRIKTKNMTYSGYNWAKSQTWQKIANQYLTLWQKNV